MAAQRIADVDLLAFDGKLHERPVVLLRGYALLPLAEGVFLFKRAF
jgi:hypothetical protein